MRHDIGGGSFADGSVSKEAGSPVFIDLKILSAVEGFAPCWLVDQGRDDGNEHNAIVHIEIGMPMVHDLPATHDFFLG